MSKAHSKTPDMDKLDQLLIRVQSGVLLTQALTGIGTLNWFNSLDQAYRARVMSAYLERKAKATQYRWLKGVRKQGQ